MGRMTAQRAFALMYHDVVERKARNRYEIEADAFARHLVAIRQVLSGRRPGLVTEIRDCGAAPPCFLTFDDGAESAFQTIAPLLEAFGWHGHFFVISNFIGRPGVMTAAQIRELAARGHEIGSHSASHPERFGHLPAERIAREWRESAQRLSEIVGKPVRTASVPNGDFSLRVATLAAAAGITALFTSVPTTRVVTVGDCAIYGRFLVQRGDSEGRAAAFATGCVVTHLQQALLWWVKELARAGSASVYETRRLALSHYRERPSMPGSTLAP
jgi:hypothetical protein